MNKRLIYAEDAIDALDFGCELLRRALDDTDVVGVERAKYEWGLGLIESYIADIKELPSAKPQRIKGIWLPHGIPWYQCSECGAVRENKTFMENFCPNCGADMRGEQDD